MSSYELMFIVKPDLDEEEVNTATDRVHQLLVANGGSVTRTASWGKRRLAYRVGPQIEGYYVVSNFEIESSKIAEMERVLKISDTVFRHLLVRRDRPPEAEGEVHVPEPTAEDLAEWEAPEEAVAGVAEEEIPPADAELLTEEKAKTALAVAGAGEPEPTATEEEAGREPE
jgi:small subunit ribosomal protein S6